MLEHLRGLWKVDPSSKALMEGAAVKHKAGDRLSVEAGPTERHAGKALMYAVLKLVDRLPEPVFQPPTLRVTRESGPRAPKREVVYLALPGLGKVRIGPEDYYTEAELRLGEALDTVPLEQLGGRNPERPDLGGLPQVSFEPDLLETGETAHFDASSREGHWGTVYMDGRTARDPHPLVARVGNGESGLGGPAREVRTGPEGAALSKTPQLGQDRTGKK